METIMMVFMAFACIVCAFSVTVITVDMIRELARRRKPTEYQQPAPAPTPAPTPAPAQEVAPSPAEQPAPVVATAVVEQTPQEETPEKGVWIATNKNETLEQKYLALSKEQKSWYDEIEQYALKVADVRCFKNERYVDYKVGKNRIVRLTIKRGVIQCEFVLVNEDFRNYVNENKVSVKQAASILKVESAEAVIAAKSGIDIAVKAVEEERLFKKEQAKIRRREARAKKAQQ